MRGREFTLLGSDGQFYKSVMPGTLGGYRKNRIYGRLDCPSALRAIANGHYKQHRVFFADEVTALAAGFRPCAKCLPEQYRNWKGNPPIGMASTENLGARKQRSTVLGT